MTGRSGVEVVVVGAGSAGLATSWHLTRRGIEHIVLERGRVAETWRSKRWDSFHLVVPNRYFELPGYPYGGPAPDGFMSRTEIVDRFSAYAKAFGAPIHEKVAVIALEPEDGGYRLTTDAGTLHARAVVVASGAYQSPVLPGCARELPAGVSQIHSDSYRNPGQLPPGGTLVVGGGQFGAQIAEELADSGRQVYWSIGSCGWFPRRYRGRDVVDWASAIGFMDVPVEALPSPAARRGCYFKQVSGSGGGHALTPMHLAGKGVRVLGRLLACRGSVLALGRTVQETIAKAEAEQAMFMEQVDAHIKANGIDAPPAEPSPELAPVPESPAALDLGDEGITSFLWATGYRLDFGWIRPGIFDDDGYPRQLGGVSEAAGPLLRRATLAHQAQVRDHPRRRRGRGTCGRPHQPDAAGRGYQLTVKKNPRVQLSADLQEYISKQPRSAHWFSGHALTWIRATGSDTQGRLSLVEQIVPPGFATPWHVHHRENESFYVVAGRIRVKLEGRQAVSLGAGGFAFGPMGIPHAFRVEGDAPVRLLLMTDGPSFAAFIREASDPVMTDRLPEPTPPDLARLRALALEHDQELLGPPSMVDYRSQAMAAGVVVAGQPSTS